MARLPLAKAAKTTRQHPRSAACNPLKRAKPLPVLVIAQPPSRAVAATPARFLSLQLWPLSLMSN